MENELITITDEFLKSGMNGGVGISRKQLIILGLDGTFQSGWKKKLIGKTISKETAEKYLAARKIRKGKPVSGERNLAENRNSQSNSVELKYLATKKNDELTEEDKKIILFCIQERLNTARQEQNTVETLALENVIKKLTSTNSQAL